MSDAYRLRDWFRGWCAYDGLVDVLFCEPGVLCQFGSSDVFGCGDWCVLWLVGLLLCVPALVIFLLLWLLLLWLVVLFYFYFIESDLLASLCYHCYSF